MREQEIYNIIQNATNGITSEKLIKKLNKNIGESHQRINVMYTPYGNMERFATVRIAESIGLVYAEPLLRLVHSHKIVVGRFKKGKHKGKIGFFVNDHSLCHEWILQICSEVVR